MDFLLQFDFFHNTQKKELFMAKKGFFTLNSATHTLERKLDRYNKEISYYDLIFFA